VSVDLMSTPLLEVDAMRFLLLLHGDEAAEEALPRDQRMAIVEAHGGFSKALRDAGKHVYGEPLGSSREGKIVSKRGVNDGPFAETKEQLGGFYVIEADSIDEAVDWARQVPESPGLQVEVRAIPEF
jgi:hypothetical protein